MLSLPHLNRAFLLLGFGLLAAACQRNDADVAPREVEDPDWIRLEIKTIFSGDEAYSIVGDIDQTLLVATKAQVYATSDGGKTWKESRNFYSPMYGLLERNDTIFALTSYLTDSQGERTATHPDLFTTNFGRTWAYIDPLPGLHEKYRNLTQPLGRVEAAGVVYRTQENTVPTANPTIRSVVASDLLRTDGTGQSALRLPARHYLKGLHLDAQQRLYVAASGLRFDAGTGQAINPTVGRPAVVYVSRRPRP